MGRKSLQKSIRIVRKFAVIVLKKNNMVKTICRVKNLSNKSFYGVSDLLFYKMLDKYLSISFRIKIFFNPKGIKHFSTSNKQYEVLFKVNILKDVIV